MINILNLLSEETFSEKMDLQNQLLLGIMESQGYSLPKGYTWRQVQTMVRNGTAASVFPVGEQITVKKEDTVLTFDVVAHDVAVPADASKTHSMTLMLHNCYKSLMFDNEETNNTDTGRKSFGNNRYRYSNIRLWLNSKGAAGGWYVNQHQYDAAPNYATTENGFMYGFDLSFLAVLGKTKIKTVIPTVDGGSYEELEDYFYLPSVTEVGLENENSIAEGALFPYFDSNSKRIKYGSDNAAKYWWLRTPYSSSSNRVRNVSTDGTRNDYYAYHPYGAAPACNII